MFTVVKRDGKHADFNLSKISTAIQQAFEATGNAYTPEIIDLLALRVTADFQKKIEKKKNLHVVRMIFSL